MHDRAIIWKFYTSEINYDDLQYMLTAQIYNSLGYFLLFFTVKKGLCKDGAGNQHAQNRPSAYSWCDDQWLWWSEPEVWIWGRSCLLPWLSLTQNQINTNVALWCYQPTSCHMQVLNKDGIENVLLCMYVLSRK